MTLHDCGLWAGRRALYCVVLRNGCLATICTLAPNALAGWAARSLVHLCNATLVLDARSPLLDTARDLARLHGLRLLIAPGALVDALRLVSGLDRMAPVKSAALLARIAQLPLALDGLCLSTHDLVRPTARRASCALSSRTRRVSPVSHKPLPPGSRDSRRPEKQMITHSEFRAAPELAHLGCVLAALDALETTLIVETPSLDDLSPQVPTALLRTLALLSQLRVLRREIGLYRRSLLRVLRHGPDDSCSF